ncbi:hypothetical protein FF38_02206 [Lucilia cuprina]|uniref:Enkurin domain-containing protein n=1 Tax=Lucilia cuprina TaxID=7375 RepID=A0A0L0BVW3_LUCCU|nr:Enkurin domain-containing protein 1 [Lucilia cuprina]KNC24190.1 hypothetical protein FF38_02206 [Lucilia cuprina]
MTTRTQTSAMSLQTLRGVFEQPKMNHRRDFLRENKLNLRELQKNTTHKLTQQKQDNERKQNKHLQRFHKTQEQTTLAPRRSASQCKNVECNGGRQSRNEGITAAGVPTIRGKPNYLGLRRAYSQQRQSVENLQTVEANERIGVAGGGGCTAEVPTIRGKPNYLGLRRAYSQQRQSVENLETSCQCHQPQRQTQERETQYRERMPRSESAISIVSKAESCDKEIQTEDIHDEDFLYEALKKCSSSEVHHLHKQKTNDQLHDSHNALQRSQSNYTLQQYEPETKSIHSVERAPYNYQDHYEDHKHQHDQQMQFTTRSQNTQISNGHHHTVEQENEMFNGIEEDLEKHFQNLKMNGHVRIPEPEPLSSARSRQTMCSTSTKRSIHKLGCREDVRLPRYLEKEKREKKEERMRELTKDPNCPSGHYALTEEERLKVLHKAQQKMSSLINELNHMPMTTETLRIRQRKVEIEKELTQLELDIRLYSKPKVYIAETPIQY